MGRPVMGAFLHEFARSLERLRGACVFFIAAGYNDIDRLNMPLMRLRAIGAGRNDRKGHQIFDRLIIRNLAIGQLEAKRACLTVRTDMSNGRPKKGPDE